MLENLTVKKYSWNKNYTYILGNGTRRILILDSA